MYFFIFEDYSGFLLCWEINFPANPDNRRCSIFGELWSRICCGLHLSAHVVLPGHSCSPVFTFFSFYSFPFVVFCFCFFIVSRPAQASGLRWDDVFIFCFKSFWWASKPVAWRGAQGKPVLVFVSSSVLTAMIMMIMTAVSVQLLSPQYRPLTQ